MKEKRNIREKRRRKEYAGVDRIIDIQIIMLGIKERKNIKVR